MTKTEITTAEPLVIDPNAPVLFIDDVAAFGMVGSVVHLTVSTTLYVPKDAQPNVAPKSVVCAHLRTPAHAVSALRYLAAKRPKWKSIRAHIIGVDDWRVHACKRPSRCPR